MLPQYLFSNLPAKQILINNTFKAVEKFNDYLFLCLYRLF